MDHEIIVPPGVDVSRQPFSPGVRVGNLLFLSGSAGVGADGQVPGDDIESQARQAFENLGEVLQAAGSSWSKVVKVTCYLTHPQRDLAGWNKVWKEYFPKDPPARTTVGAEIARQGALIEVELIAVV